MRAEHRADPALPASVALSSPDAALSARFLFRSLQGQLAMSAVC